MTVFLEAVTSKEKGMTLFGSQTRTFKQISGTHCLWNITNASSLGPDAAQSQLNFTGMNRKQIQA